MSFNGRRFYEIYVLSCGCDNRGGSCFGLKKVRSMAPAAIIPPSPVASAYRHIQGIPPPPSASPPIQETALLRRPRRIPSSTPSAIPGT
jgi:hypothetical protein